MKHVLKIFKALSDKNRIRILMILAKGPLCVCEITAILQMSVSTISKHLSILRDVGFISDEKSGKWVNYRINDCCADMPVQHILILLQLWLNKDEMVIADLEKVQSIDRNILCNIQ
jgi:ArsR family transcriptional regulator, arsenate/arsenite/antimonite-responsive transcriptional repressor